MDLVNETQQDVSYWISCDAVGPNCGDIPVNGIVELKEYDNQIGVLVSFKPADGSREFSMTVTTDGHDGEQIEMALVAELGQIQT
jgi:hypothetical protein